MTEIDMRYDPMRSPIRDEWTELDEGEQIASVCECHRGASITVPNLRVHAAMHVAVENQVLIGDESPEAEALNRLTAAGIDRHDAIHAVASVLASVMFDASKAQGGDDLKRAYDREVSKLTAAKWLLQADDEAGP